MTADYRVYGDGTAVGGWARSRRFAVITRVRRGSSTSVFAVVRPKRLGEGAFRLSSERTAVNGWTERIRSRSTAFAPRADPKRSRKQLETNGWERTRTNSLHDVPEFAFVRSFQF